MSGEDMSEEMGRGRNGLGKTDYIPKKYDWQAFKKKIV
jgi:hypothetical protein